MCATDARCALASAAILAQRQPPECCAIAPIAAHARRATRDTALFSHPRNDVERRADARESSRKSALRDLCSAENPPPRASSAESFLRPRARRDAGAAHRCAAGRAARSHAQEFSQTA
jgi:hypothetical protein